MGLVPSKASYRWHVSGLCVVWHSVRRATVILGHSTLSVKSCQKANVEHTSLNAPEQYNGESGWKMFPIAFPYPNILWFHCVPVCYIRKQELPCSLKLNNSLTAHMNQSILPWDLYPMSEDYKIHDVSSHFFCIRCLVHLIQVPKLHVPK